MIAKGTLTEADTPGVYTVHGLTDIPFQVVIIGELEGEAYAAYRVLKKHAEVTDVELLLDRLQKADKENDQNMMDRLHRILDLVEKKNHGSVADKIREKKEMKSVFMDVLKPEIDVVVKDARADEHEKTTRTNLFLYVQDGDMIIEKAAKRANMSTADFSTAMTNAGYKLPQTM